PLLAVSAVGQIRDYVRSGARVERALGAAGLLLVAMTAVIHLAGTIPAYVARNREDAATVLAIAALPDRVGVADDEFTAQLLLPLYYRKIIFLAGTRDLGLELGRRLADNRIASAVLVTRREAVAIPLMPYGLDRTEVVGRMRIQYWRR